MWSIYLFTLFVFNQSHNYILTHYHKNIIWIRVMWPTCDAVLNYPFGIVELEFSRRIDWKPGENSFKSNAVAVDTFSAYYACSHKAHLKLTAIFSHRITDEIALVAVIGIRHYAEHTIITLDRFNVWTNAFATKRFRLFIVHAFDVNVDCDGVTVTFNQRTD